MPPNVIAGTLPLVADGLPTGVRAVECGRARMRHGRRSSFVVGGVAVALVAVCAGHAFSSAHRSPARRAQSVMAALTAATAPSVPTASVANGLLSFVDSPAHTATIAFREDPDNANDAIIATNTGRLQPGSGCRYLSQTDSDPSNDTAPGYDSWLRCANATGPWVIQLGDGNDQISVSHPTRTTDVGDGKDIQVDASDGDDTVSILDGSASVDGRLGNDVIRGGPDDDVLHGGPGYDKLISGRGKGAAHDELYGDDGNDTLIGGRSQDILDGGPGLDVLTPGGARDTINARDGEADEVDCGGDNAVADVLHFDPGVDKLFHCGAEVKKNPGGA